MMNINDFLRFRCAGRIGKSMLFSWYAVHPLSHVLFYSQHIHIRVWPFKKVLKYENIKEIREIRSYLFMIGARGFQIIHNGERHPYIAFWCKEHDKTIKAFKSRNITITCL